MGASSERSILLVPIKYTLLLDKLFGLLLLLEVLRLVNLLLVVPEPVLRLVIIDGTADAPCLRKLTVLTAPHEGHDALVLCMGHV